ncbi:hypothetical protein BLOT_010771 [Blomia tropicalis]|nr:hypothetical protein BLOT_010771 [Blomia tropicalis]
MQVLAPLIYDVSLNKLIPHKQDKNKLILESIVSWNGSHYSLYSLRAFSMRQWNTIIIICLGRDPTIVPTTKLLWLQLQLNKKEEEKKGKNHGQTETKWTITKACRMIKLLNVYC